jgi:hypothetical protein
MEVSQEQSRSAFSEESNLSIKKQQSIERAKSFISCFREAIAEDVRKHSPKAKNAAT